jgi:hypothetical protein
MKVIISQVKLELGDIFKYNGKEWQVITVPEDSGLQGHLNVFTAREQKIGLLEYTFFNQVD